MITRSVRLLKSFRILSGFSPGHYRHINYDIGQPTSYSHPHLMKEGEGRYIHNMIKPMPQPYSLVTPLISKEEYADRRNKLAEYVRK